MDAEKVKMQEDLAMLTKRVEALEQAARDALAKAEREAQERAKREAEERAKKFWLKQDKITKK